MILETRIKGCPTRFVASMFLTYNLTRMQNLAGKGLFNSKCASHRDLCENCVAWGNSTLSLFRAEGCSMRELLNGDELWFKQP